MSPVRRRIVQAVLYEIVAIVVVGPVLGLLFDKPVASSLGLGFEGGLVFLLVPVMAWGLDTTLWTAFFANLGLMAFFFVYAIAFTWAFDTIFGPPASATEGKP